VFQDSEVALLCGMCQDSLPKKMGERLHFLDWFRILMIWVVVYGHLFFSGILPSPEVMEDNHAYAWAGQKSSLGVRYISIVRQWCIPLLFWVSGAAASISYKGDWMRLNRSLAKIGAITITGLFVNGLIWAASPQEPQCSPMSPCTGKGTIFDFTVVPDAGKVFPVIFQMWFTMCLLLLMFLNRPLFCALSQQGSMLAVSVQWLCTMLLSTAALQVSAPKGGSILSTWPLLVWIALSEAIFDLAALATDSAWLDLGEEKRRFLHYICAVAAVAQVSLSPMNVYLGNVTGLYIFLMCNKLYALGFVMTKNRGNAAPLMSHVWPLVVVLGVLVAPSSSWSMSGHMTYPYYADALDRGLYLAGALTIIFALDRISRYITCKQLPDFLEKAGLLLYLLHPAIATCLIACGVQTIASVWLLATGIAVAIAYAGWGLRHAMNSRTSSNDGYMVLLP